MKKTVLVSLLAMVLGAAAPAVARDHSWDGGGRGAGGYDGHRGGNDWDRGGGRHDGGHHHDRGGADYDDGILVGLVASTAALFVSDLTANHSQAVYLHADNDAAAFLAGEEATPALVGAMNYERGFLARTQVQGAAQLSDSDIAYMVMKRSEALN